MESSSFAPLAELDLVYTTSKGRRSCIHVGIAGPYAPALSPRHQDYAACQVVIGDKESASTEVFGANKLDALEAGLRTIRVYLEVLRRRGDLRYPDGSAYDPEGVDLYKTLESRLIGVHADDGASMNKPGFVTNEVPYVLNPVEELERARSKLGAATNGYERWVALGNVALWSVDTGNFNEAQAYAHELLAGCALYEGDWNYGNAIHKANLTLGRISIQKGDIAKAKEYLLCAGTTVGSPQLDSFGPNMILAKELLELGERQVVEEYLSLCERFWKNGQPALAAWRRSLANGKIPNFMGNLVY